MNRIQEHRATQILGFVNRTLRHLPNTEQPDETQAQYLIMAAMVNEKDPVVIEHCNNNFREWYNCEG